MNIRSLTYRIGSWIMSLVTVTITLSSCQEEKFDVPDYTLSGEDVRLNVAVSIPAMDVQSRADLSTDGLNRVNTLWVRTYSADTGKATSEWVDVAGLPTTSTVEPTMRNVTIDTKSGRSYIVAVANVDNMGVKAGDLNRRPLRELLNEADTWEQFLAIGAVTPSEQGTVRAPNTPLTMVGCYSDMTAGDHRFTTPINEWQDQNFQEYFIPATGKLIEFEGCIHLRRLVSHIFFNVIPGNDVNVTVNSFQVINAPRYSWLYERPETKGIPNFGDLATDAEDATNYYAEIDQFGFQFVTENEADGTSSFNFWQGENKHTGTSATYHDRDKKLDKDSPYFTSLGDSWNDDQEASYVVINCTVDYKNKINVNDEGVIGAGNTEVTRTGEVTYFIHLGYINGENDAQKSTDFSCFRNVNYRYNLTVNGVNDIRLDAFATDADPEKYNGEEGMVVDLSNSTINLDAHYAVFNIQLTEEELSDQNFGFIITTWDNGTQYTITDKNTQKTETQTTVVTDNKGNIIDAKYYNWIELRATTGENVLAEYRPRYQQTGTDKITFLLTDLKGGWNNMTERMKSDENGWYTVFVNEYTYEPMYTGQTGSQYGNETILDNGRPAWMNYVNQNPRRFYIRVTQKESPDENSVYARSKYGVSQQSLMTYYSQINETPDDTAIGLERENETLGMNVRYPNNGGSSTSNGRWNIAEYLELNLTGTTANWENYLNLEDALYFPAVNTDRLQGGPAIPGGKSELRAPVLETEGGGYTFSDPQDNNNYVINALNACMNRNRDNNGNGLIDPEELRWYVPALDQMLQFAIGKDALPEPMMDYQRITGLPYVNSSNTGWGTAGNGKIQNDFYSRYMFAASNSGNNVMWAMEGTSTSSWANAHSWGNNATNPWDVRCIRNLGTDLTTIRNDDKVEKAYTHDEDNHIFRMNYFNLATIRTTKYDGNGTTGDAMPVHTIAGPENSVYSAFEYSTTDVIISSDNLPTYYANQEGNNIIKPSDKEIQDTYDNIANYINSDPCASVDGLSGTGWRVPNQVELTIMRNAGLIPLINVNYMWLSCTVNYFNYVNGAGSITDTSDRYYLTVISGSGTQFTPNNYRNANGRIYLRCVRDVD